MQTRDIHIFTFVIACLTAPLASLIVLIGLVAVPITYETTQVWAWSVLFLRIPLLYLAGVLCVLASYISTWTGSNNTHNEHEGHNPNLNRWRNYTAIAYWILLTYCAAHIFGVFWVLENG